MKIKLSFKMTNMRYKGIFGSPEEPFFNDKIHGVAPDILKEWLIQLNLKNRIGIENYNIKLEHFHNFDVVEFIFKLCQKLRLPSNVKYHAVDLFERFILEHIEDLHKHSAQSKSRDKEAEWDEILTRIQNQLFLRLVSCCQICSKINSHYNVVTVKRAKNFLRDIDLKYSPTSIINSEIRVLQTLNFNVLTEPPIVFLETILEIIGYNDPNLTVKPYHGVCLQVLDVVYLKRSEIYEELFMVLTKRRTPLIDEKKDFYRIKCDKLLLAVSVLAAAVYISDQTQTDKVIEHLHKITKRSSEDILDFCTVIVQSIVEGNTKHQESVISS